MLLDCEGEETRTRTWRQICSGWVWDAMSIPGRSGLRHTLHSLCRFPSFRQQSRRQSECSSETSLLSLKPSCRPSYAHHSAHLGGPMSGWRHRRGSTAWTDKFGFGQCSICAESPDWAGRRHVEGNLIANCKNYHFVASVIRFFLPTP